MNEAANDWTGLPSGWTGLVDVELSGLSAPQQARWAIREHLAGVVTVPFLRDVMLATSEVITNAIRYAPGPCRLTMAQHSGSSLLRIGVTDGNPELPHTVEPTADPTSSGRGLMIVESVSSAWGTTPLSTGKEVWFEMTPDRPS